MRRKLILLALLAACTGKGDGTVSLPSRPVEGPRANELPPVPLNPNSPVDYPPTLAAQGIEGTVLLRLMVEANGVVVRDSTRVAESSGYPALDSAAMQAVPSLRYAPAERDGAKVAMAFLQPIYFRTPQGRGVTP